MDRVQTGAKQIVIISEAISICILTVVFIFARPIVTAFGLGPEAIEYCTSHVRCVSVCLILFASNFPFLGLFQGANDDQYSTFVATSALAIRVASAYILQVIHAISYPNPHIMDCVVTNHLSIVSFLGMKNAGMILGSGCGTLEITRQTTYLQMAYEFRAYL